MTSSTDVMVASHKTASYKTANRHVAIGSSNTAVTSPEGSLGTPNNAASHTFDHNIAATSSTITTNTTNEDISTSPLEAVTRLYVTRLSPDSSRVRHPREEYYDVLHPEPKDQTQDQPDIAREAVRTPDLLVSLGESQVRYVVDPLTGWPLRRSESLESRDNPFLPGGELSREAEDLLSRATIIRDHFYLNEDEKRTLREHQQKQQQEQQEKQQRNAKHVHIVEHTDEALASSDIKGRQQSSPPSSEAVEERISPQANNLAAAAPASSPNGGDNHQLQTRENGKVKASTASSSNDKLAIPDGENQSHPPGQTDRTGTGDVPAQISGAGELQVHEPDKKRRNKCCSIM